MARIRIRRFSYATVITSSLIGCEQIIGGDFDPKTVYPDHFGEGGDGGEAAKSSSGDGDNGPKTRGDGDGDGTGDGDDSGRNDDGSGGGDDGSGGTTNSGGSGDDTGSGGDSSSGASSGSGGTTGSGGETSTTVCRYGQTGCEFDVVLNEVRGQGGTDFIELYNRGVDTVHLEGCSLSDGGPGNPDLGNRLVFQSAPGHNVLAVEIPPGGYLFFQDSAESVCIAAHCGGFISFGISAAGESVFFLAPDLSPIDTFNYPDENNGGLVNGQTLGRSPDGATAIGPLNPATPGGANSAFDNP